MNRNETLLLEALGWFLNDPNCDRKEVEARWNHARQGQLHTIKAWRKTPDYLDVQQKARQLVIRVMGYDKLKDDKGSPPGTKQFKFVFELSNTAGRETKPYLFSGQDDSGHHVLEYRMSIMSVWGAVQYTYLLLLGDDLLRRRIGICANENCDKFFVDLRERGGKRQAYCSASHSTSARMKRFRSRPRPEPTT